MLDPTTEHVRALRAVVGEDPVLLTLAPERGGAPRAVAAASNAGFRVSLGHTDADAQQLDEAIAAGATGFTHLGNACPQHLDRHENILWRVLDRLRPQDAVRSPETGAGNTRDALPGTTTGQEQSPFSASLIPDGLHVPETLFRVLHAAAAPSRLFYVSDAMAGAGAQPGPATLGPLELQVGADGVVRQPGCTNFAGSALRPMDGVFRAARMLNVDWAECWDRFSVLPAEWMGWPVNRLEIGSPADFCLFDAPDTPPQPPAAQRPDLGRVRMVTVRGQQVYSGRRNG
jgi:N-acetylglucosamine-6-phosphate deacetylase